MILNKPSDSFKRVEDLNSPILLENDMTWSLTLDRSRHLATVACKIVWWTQQTTAIPSHHPRRRTTVYQSKTTEITSSSTRKCTKLFQNRNANYSNMKMKWITGYLRITKWNENADQAQYFKISGSSHKSREG